jgi:hypothetical protein
LVNEQLLFENINLKYLKIKLIIFNQKLNSVSLSPSVLRFEVIAVWNNFLG